MDPDGRPKNILLVEDHHLLRQAMAEILAWEPGIAAVFQAGSLAEAARAPGGLDVAVVDPGLPDGDGITLVTTLREANPGCAILVVTASPDEAGFARAVEAGAAGVIHKASPLDEIVGAVRRLCAGEALLSPGQIIEWMGLADLQRARDAAAVYLQKRLTPREREVLQALAEGLDNKEISHRLGISPDTGRNYVASLLAKLGVHTRLQALVTAIRHDLVDVGPKGG